MKLLLFFIAMNLFVVLQAQDYSQPSSIQPTDNNGLMNVIPAQQRLKPIQKIAPAIFKTKPFKKPSTGHGVFIDFVGTGDIQKTISEGQDIQANTGLGIVYERVSDQEDRPFQSLELDAFINIFTTADTLMGEFANGRLVNRRSFSSNVLNPISSRQSTYINANYYFGYPDNGFGKFANYVSGVNARFIASNNVWQYNLDTIRNIASLYARLGVFHEILPDNYRYDEKTGRVKYSCTIGLNYSFRGLFGDLSSESNEGVREKFLGNNRTNFGGLELNFGFRLNNIRTEFQMPILSGKNGKAIEGLTNTQFLFSIKFVGGFGLKLNSEEASGDRTNVDK